MYFNTLDHLSVEVTAACELDTANDEPASGLNRDIPLYSDVDSMIVEQDLDVVFVTVPNRETPTVVETAVDNGVDVYSEKPMARSATDLQQVATKLRHSDSTITVSYANRARPEFAGLREKRASGEFGKITAIEMRIIASQIRHRVSNPGTFIYDQESSRGGVLQWLGCHYIDLVHWVLQDPIERVCAQTRTDTSGADVESSAILQFEARNDTVGTLVCGYHFGPDTYDITFNVYGTKASATFPRKISSTAEENLTEVTVRYANADRSAPSRFFGYDYSEKSGYLGQVGENFVRQFFDACGGDAKNPATIEDALAVLRVLDAAYESAESGEWITVDHSGHHAMEDATDV